ncbi:MAG: hypothetical protein QXI84_04050 [Thermofilaceae archaeon]
MDFGNFAKMVLAGFAIGYYALALYLLVISPFIPSGDDTYIHLAKCLHFNLEEYLTQQYPNVVHALCHASSGGDLIKAITFWKVFVFTTAILVPAAILYLAARLPTTAFIAVALFLVGGGQRYIQTIADGTVIYIFSFTTLIAYWALIRNNRHTAAGAALGLGTAHYFGVVNIIIALPSLLSKNTYRKTLIGFLIGAAPSIPKYINASLKIASSQGVGQGGGAPLGLDLAIGYPFTKDPTVEYGLLYFTAFIATATYLLFKARGYERAIALSVLIYIATGLAVSRLGGEAATSLALRLLRLFPIYATFFIASVADKMPKGLHTLTLAMSALLVVINAYLWPPIERITGDALIQLYQMRQEICQGQVLGVLQVTPYLETICGFYVPLAPPQYYAGFAPEDPRATLGKVAMENLDNPSKLSQLGFKILVIQRPIEGMWYIPELSALAETLYNNATRYGKIIYEIHQGPIHILIIETYK